MRQLPKQQARQNDTQCRDRVRIMPLGAYSASLAAESPVTIWRRVIQHGRRGLRGKTATLGHQEAIRGDTKSSVMMKSPPTPAFIVAQPQLLFEFFLVTLDDPAVFGKLHQRLQCRVGWQV